MLPRDGRRTIWASASETNIDGAHLLGGALPSPLMAVRESSLLANIETMARYCTDHGVLLAPHGKTTMSPQVFALQMSAGAWAMTAATGAHVQTYHALGIRFVLLANELVDRATIRFVAAHMRAEDPLRLICFVDSVEAVRLLEDELAAAHAEVPLEVLLELGVPGGRAGCRTVEEGLCVASVVEECAHLQLVGVAGYEGPLGRGRDARSLGAVEQYCAELLTLARRLDEAGFLADVERPILSAGGSAYFDVVVGALAGQLVGSRSPLIVLRSGAYVAHDDGFYDRLSPFARAGGRYALKPALRVWGRVLSVPEPGLAIADFGRRDVPFDQDLPVVLERRSPDGRTTLRAEGLLVTALNDQHAFVDCGSQADVGPGQWVGCGISHPCTAFDKWRSMPVVDDADVIVGHLNTSFP
jgi:D-serine deaminase-like pyridoxal phosphate-dependent protein